MIDRVSRAGLLALLAWGASAAAEPPLPLLRAETTDFRATSTYDETLDFVRQLAERSPFVRVETFGTSAQGRALPLVILSGDRAFTPDAAARTGKPILLIQNGIHAGEIDGKDASLMLLRDVALGRAPEILDALILLVVPIYNVDGHERVSPYNRPNQNGPVEGMGFRTTADGHDLNRDHVKLDTPEARAAIALFNRWRPHLHVDNHVTNGADHDWVLTHSWAEAPQVAPSIDAWLASHMPRVVRATRAKGHRLGPYVSLIDRNDPERGFDSVVAEARYATGYYPLRNRPSILVENHAYKPYRERVLANRDFMLALFDAVAAAPATLVEAVAQAERRTVELGRPAAKASEIVVRYARAEADRMRLPIYDWYLEPSVVLGRPLLRYRRGIVRETEVPWVHRLVPELTVPRPRGYLILPGWPAIDARVEAHGLRTLRLARAVELEVESLRIADTQQRRPAPYQGLTPVVPAVERIRESRRIPAGALWIPADQPDFDVAAQLLEPECPDSLVSWGLLSIAMERKEYIDGRVLEALAVEMLEDPAIAAAWERALEDEEFASDRGARYLWWYRRTPYWDETVGLLPYYRVLAASAIPSAELLVRSTTPRPEADAR